MVLVINKVKYVINGIFVEISNRFRKLTHIDKYSSLVYDYNSKDQVDQNLEEKSFSYLEPLPSKELTILKEEINQIFLKVQNQKLNDFYKYIIYSKEMNADSHIFNLVLNEKLISHIQKYLGTRVLLHGIRILYSESNPKFELSRYQLWHRDKYDSKCLRLFLYLDDCLLENGPFQYIPLEKSKSIWRTYLSRVDDRYLKNNNLENQIHYVTAKAGDMFLADVRKLVHCGSRIKKGNRLILSAIYTSSKPWNKPSIDEGLVQELLKKDFSELQKSVLYR